MAKLQCAVIVLAIAAAFTTTAQGRAVNISNTWMLPEEGFPVFYRYFRDRISWYEADAVCQFHHANLVTADTSSQYDAIRAYLKELDITSNVWIGLSRTAEKPLFTWSNSFPLSREGHWQEAIPVGKDPLCVVMDPSADFLWKALPCGGPEVAAFICELPIPEWAAGPRGCLLTELPSLTVLYIPERSAVELTSDCGLDGTKRIACKGNADREEMLKQLTCTIPQDEDFDEKSTKQPIASSTQFDISDDNNLSSKTTRPWLWTSNTIETDYGMPTRHRRETEETLSPISTKSTTALNVFPRNKQSNISERVLGNSNNKELSATAFIPLKDSTVEFKSLSENLNHQAVIDLESFDNVHDTNTPEVPVEIPDTIDTTNPSVNVRIEISSTVSEEASVGLEGLSPTNDDAEYPSAINQGQLFSIIENGTMFDIIELNETGQEDIRTKEEEISTMKTVFSTVNSVNEQSITVVNIKEDKIMSQKLLKKFEKKNKELPKEIVNKKVLIKQLDPKKQNNLKKVKTEANKLNNITKEVEMFPIIKDNSTILNRTHRKEVPPVFRNKEELVQVPISIPEKRNAPFNLPKLLKDVHGNGSEEKSENQEKLINSIQSTTIITPTSTVIPKLDKLSNVDDKLSTMSNTATERPRPYPLNPVDPYFGNKQNYLETRSDDIKRDMFYRKERPVAITQTSEFDTSTETSTSQEIEEVYSKSPLISDAMEPAKLPNRQRQLTRPQRRSFYPYFFSRVLG